MPRPRKQDDSETQGEEVTLASRIVRKLQGDKEVKDVVKLASGSLFSEIPYYIPTGCSTLNYAIGRPGYPAGKITTIFGREASGKSTLVYEALRQTQLMGGLGVLVDSEGRYTRERAAAWGLDPESLIVIEGASLENSFEAIEKVIDEVRSSNISIPILVVYDSLAGAPTNKRMEGNVNDVMVSQAARFVSAELPRLKMKLGKLGVALIIVNQVRQRINMGDPRTGSYRERIKVMGAQYSMIAEMALIFESSLMIHTNEMGKVGDKEHPTGMRSKATVRKCGIAPREGWVAEFDIDYLHGVDHDGADFELLDMLGEIAHSSSGWYKVRATDDEYDDGYGWDNRKKYQRGDFKKMIADHPWLAQKVMEAPTLWANPTTVAPESSLLSAI